MNRDRWRQVEELYHLALEREPEERGGFIAQVCRDADIRREVETLLLETHSRTLLDLPAWQAGARLLADVESPDGRFAPGAVLAGRYRIVALIGHGGMGEVYWATDLTLSQNVALKFLPESLAHDPASLNRLYNEVRLARQVSHPNICRVYDIVEADGLRFITMEYIDGEDLQCLLKRIGRVPVEKAIDIARHLCAGLSAAHERGVLHRDLKPANIMIDAQGNVRITDFGLAILTERIEARDIGSGTPLYMAPEHLAGEQVSVSSDIYALGLVLYEMFGGCHPFKEISEDDLLKVKRSLKPASIHLRADVDRDIERAIMRCLEPDPRDRPHSAAAVAAALSGGDALAATIAAGETPVPELVARAGGNQGLPIRVAVACLCVCIVSLIAASLLTPRVNVLSRMQVENPAALERVARDKLAGLGISPPQRHRVYAFAYEMEAIRRHSGVGGLYFWYRASPYWMVPLGNFTAVTPDDPPLDVPGMVTTKWDTTGRLLFLKSIPQSSGPPQPASELWPKLFQAAGLQLPDFNAAEAGWIPASEPDARQSWTGAYPDANRTPIRVDAAAWQGQPVYFSVEPVWRVASTPPGSITGRQRGARQAACFLTLFVVSALVACRNVRRGRGDRRGALRIAVLTFVTLFAAKMCGSNHVLDIAECLLFFSAVLAAGFFAFFCWMFFMAFEPYVRRRWPHSIISWTRVLSGRLRDPVVAGDVLVGLAFGSALPAVAIAALGICGMDGLRIPAPSLLSGTRGMFHNLLSLAWESVLRGLFLLFLTFFLKVFFRKTAFIAAGMIAIVTLLTLAFEVPISPLPPTVVVVIIVSIVLALVGLLLRTGLLSVIIAMYVIAMVSSLQLTPSLSSPGVTGSVVMVCGLAAAACFAFRTTLAGRRLFHLEL